VQKGPFLAWNGPVPTAPGRSTLPVALSQNTRNGIDSGTVPSFGLEPVTSCVNQRQQGTPVDWCGIL